MIRLLVFSAIVFWAAAFIFCAHHATGPHKINFQLGGLMSVAAVGYNLALYYKLPRKKP